MKNSIIFVAITLLVLGGIYFIHKSSGEIEKATTVAGTSTSREVALLCTTDMATQYHIHPVLEIIINGEKQVIPKDIGITPTCMRSLHTHDTMGTLHVEAPVQKDFILGDFFAVWEKPFDSMHILNMTATEQGLITMTVNGTEVDTFENTILKDKDQIVIKVTSAN